MCGTCACGMLCVCVVCVCVVCVCTTCMCACGTCMLPTFTKRHLPLLRYYLYQWPMAMTVIVVTSIFVTLCTCTVMMWLRDVLKDYDVHRRQAQRRQVAATAAAAHAPAVVVVSSGHLEVGPLPHSSSPCPLSYDDLLHG